MLSVNKMMCRAGVWMLIMCCVTSYKLYDEKRAIDLEENMIYDEQYIDPEQHYALEMSPDPVKDLMLYKFFHSLQNTDDVQLRMHSRPKFSMMEYPMAPFGYMPASELLDLRDAIAKRASEVNGSGPTVGHKVMPIISKQPKWKGKKGRKHGFRLCFLKVCTFPTF